MQILHDQVRAGVPMGPVMAFTVEPGDLHACSQGPHAVGVCVVSDVQHLMQLHARCLGPCGKNPQVRLGHTQ